MNNYISDSIRVRTTKFVVCISYYTMHITYVLEFGHAYFVAFKSKKNKLQVQF